ncbi:polysaccharide deacetylase family protein [Paenibacillus pasadenensis]|uniref:polysaccharide deacetylase family protein n=1 Tax=Paenibacillus pasadenensis TaxID=217090 RepID=UPI00203C7D32|nr:polysaccharide deacetylase family protein [Paenibacillus pasadenensis]MCM3750265.1 polysaccharide deacetylase family protein [Paenibacillus pasadenensis]
MAAMRRLRLLAAGAAIWMGWIGIGGGSGQWGSGNLHQLAAPPAASLASASAAPDEAGEPLVLEALKRASAKSPGHSSLAVVEAAADSSLPDAEQASGKTSDAAMVDEVGAAPVKGGNEEVKTEAAGKPGAAGQADVIEPEPGVAGKPDAKEPKTGVAGKPDAKEPKTGVAGKPDVKESKTGVAGKPDVKESKTGVAGKSDVKESKPGTTGKPNVKETKPASPGKTVYLTFDDGPSTHTAEVLDILKKYGIKATFFMVGNHVEDRPELVKKVQKEGHAIGNHSYDHKYDRIYTSFAGYAQQTLLTEKALLKAGVATNLVRAPGGTYSNFDAAYFKAMRDAGYKMADWNVDSGDSKRVGVPAKDIVAGATSVSLKKEMTVLMHDGTGHAETVKALPAIIEFYKSKGYRFAAITPEVESPVFPVAAKLKWKRPAPAAADMTALAEQSRKLRSSAAWLAASGGPDEAMPAAAAGGKQAAGGTGKDAVVGGKQAEGSTGKDAVVGGKQAAGGTGKDAVTLGKANAAANEEVLAQQKPNGSKLPDGSKSYGTLQADVLLHSSFGELRIGYGEYGVVDGRLVVPVRRTAEALGGTVHWDAETGTAAIVGPSGIVELNSATSFRSLTGVLYAPLGDVLGLLEQMVVRADASAGLAEGWLAAAGAEP